MARCFLVCFSVLILTGCVSTGVRKPEYVMSRDITHLGSPTIRRAEFAALQAEIQRLLDKPEINVENLFRIAELSNPKIAAAWNDMGAAAGREWQTELYPNPSLEFEAEDEDFLEAGIGIPLPLFNRNQGRILETRHLAGKARKDAEALTSQMLTELVAAHVFYMTARDEVKTLQNQIVPATEKALLQVKEGYQAGKIGFLDLLDAQRTLTKGQLSLLESLKDMNVAWANLWKIVGRELEE